MAKWIIVLDEIPKRCSECPCCQYEGQYDRSCGENGEDIDVDWYSQKPDWCPIKKIPERLEELKQPHSINDYQRKGFSKGFNACLEEIERSAGE